MTSFEKDRSVVWDTIPVELKKELLNAPRPSVFFETLRQANQLSVWFPELEALIGVRQNPKHHAEGDVWTHTMMVLDEASQYRDRVTNPYGFMLAAVTHDFGKAVCTQIVNGEVHAYDHETKGLPLVEAFLRRITSDKKLMEYVLNLTQLHMKPNTVAAARSSVKVTNKMFDQAVDPVALICIAVSDSRGKIAPRPYIPYDAFLYDRLAVYHEYMSRPYVMERDLVELGIAQGAGFSEILAYAHKLRLAGVEKSSAMKQVLSYAKKLRKDKGTLRSEEVTV